MLLSRRACAQAGGNCGNLAAGAGSPYAHIFCKVLPSAAGSCWNPARRTGESAHRLIAGRAAAVRRIARALGLEAAAWQTLGESAPSR